MSSAGENMPELERQRWLDRVAQEGFALQYAAAELKGDREIVLAAVAHDGRAYDRCCLARPHVAISITIERRGSTQPRVKCGRRVPRYQRIAACPLFDASVPTH